ncbi:MAG: TetR/AcrR family transcriptional regulator [Nitratireductor sp.]
MEVAGIQSVADVNDPQALPGNVKVTREDWLAAAMETLISEGVEQVKVLTISDRLGVSRSSFYWYFKSRSHLLELLLAHWESTNTGAITKQAQAAARNMAGAVCNVFKCFVDGNVFDPQLDFAVREWSRRDAPVRQAVDRADAARLAAISAMFERHGIAAKEAEIRAATLYFTQIGYFALGVSQTLEERLANMAMYVYCMSGQYPDNDDIEDFRQYSQKLDGGGK